MTTRHDMASAWPTDAATPISLSAEAYNRLEAMIVSTQLAPGAQFTLQTLESMVGLGRTPVHDAVKRLAANKLIIVRPRSGLQIAPVDLAQERTLLPLRIEMEVFACRLATERATALDHTIFRHFIRDLEDASHELSLETFNLTDRLLNEAILAASREPLLENTLLPLQTLYRRSGWLYHRFVAGDASLGRTIDRHTGLLRAIIGGDADATARYVTTMLSEVFSVLDKIRQTVDPRHLNAGLKDLRVVTGL